MSTSVSGGRTDAPSVDEIPSYDDVLVAELHSIFDRAELSLGGHIPFTGSLDVRHCELTTEGAANATAGDHSSWRLGVVDTNRFPAGFNNVDPADHEQAARILREHSPPQMQAAQHIHVVSESHTRMLGYHDSVNLLKKLLEKAWPEKHVTNGPGLPPKWTRSCHLVLNADLSRGSEVDEELLSQRSLRGRRA